MNDAYKQKLDILTQILELTKSVVFVGDDNDAQRYIDLYGQREALFDNVKAIDQSINKTPCTDKKLEEQIKTVIKQIIKLDEEAKPYAEAALNKIKSGIKDVNTAKNLNTGYKQQFGSEGAGTFDVSN